VPGPENFAELVERHKSAVFRTLARLLGRNEDLEDLAQEVFLRLFRGLGHFRRDAKLSTWLSRIVLNVANDELRRRRQSRQDVSIDDPEARWEDRSPHLAPDAGEILDRDRLLESLRTAMSELSLRERAILALYYQEGKSYEEIAAILELPMGTMKTQLHRARERLKALVRERFFFMTDAIVDCRAVRLRVAAYLEGADRSPALAAHLAHCEACLEACLEEAFRRPTEVQLPGDFTAAVLREAAAREGTRSVLPYAVAAACVLFIVLGITAASSGLLLESARSLQQLSPRWLILALGVEAALSLLWFWRVCESD